MLLEIIISGILLAFLIFFYSIEIKNITTIKKNINVIIAVTGSRGKSTTVRFLCSLFDKAGYLTLGKVTGTKPMLILPKGKSEIIKRKGIISILEQKRVLLKRASEIKPDILITEIMSVTPEYQKIEAGLLITPDYYIITNVKEDHIGVTGENKEEILTVFLKCAPSHSKIIAMENEKKLYESTELTINNITFLKVDPNSKYLHLEKIQPGFTQTVIIAKKLCQDFDISEETLSAVISEFQFDQEVFFKKNLNKNIAVVNAFSANDVDSTKAIFLKIKEEFSSYKLIGIFCTRSDKPERTKSWIDSFTNDKWSFDTLFVYGPHFSPIKRRQYPFTVKKLDKKMLNEIHQVEEKTIFFGFGNYIGSGENIVNFWNQMENGL